MRRFLSVGFTAVLFAAALGGCQGKKAEPEVVASSWDVAVAKPPRDAGPDRPRIPKDFTWSGRYAVPDLGVEVPFSWEGRDGNFQMVAGGPDETIHFTNLIYDGELYTLTYTWPGIPRQECSHVGPFTVEQLNAGLAEASYVGEETLHGQADVRVNHFRSVEVLDLPAGLVSDLDEGIPLRVPLMAGDVYADVDNPEVVRRLLHFGLQNLYDPNLDEWILIDEVSDQPGTMELPAECRAG